MFYIHAHFFNSDKNSAEVGKYFAHATLNSVLRSC